MVNIYKLIERIEDEMQHHLESINFHAPNANQDIYGVLEDTLTALQEYQAVMDRVEVNKLQHVIINNTDLIFSKRMKLCRAIQQYIRGNNGKKT